MHHARSSVHARLCMLLLIRFQVEAHYCEEPNQYSHAVEVCERARYMEIVGKHKRKETQTPIIERVIEYTSSIGENCHTLPRHTQKLVRNIPEIKVTNGMEVTNEQDIIVITDGAVVFGVRYLKWVVAMDNEQVILMGGAQDDREQPIMMS
jgi:hypothetical protein